MAKRRRKHSNQLKFKVALEAAQGLKTRNEIASQYSVHPNQVSTWKKQLLTEGQPSLVTTWPDSDRLSRNVEQGYLNKSGDLRWNLSG